MQGEERCRKAGSARRVPESVRWRGSGIKAEREGREGVREERVCVNGMGKEGGGRGGDVVSRREEREKLGEESSAAKEQSSKSWGVSDA